MAGYRSYAPLLPLGPTVVEAPGLRFGGRRDHQPPRLRGAAVQPPPRRPDDRLRAFAGEMGVGQEHAPTRRQRRARPRGTRRAVLGGDRTELAAAPNITTDRGQQRRGRAADQAHWDRDSQVVHPPVNVDFYTPDATEPREDYFLLAGRLVGYKRPDIAIRAAVEAGVKLVVAGDGRDAAKCRKLAAEA